jgi:hypothetical protein
VKDDAIDGIAFAAKYSAATEFFPVINENPS